MWLGVLTTAPNQRTGIEPKSSVICGVLICPRRPARSVGRYGNTTPALTAAVSDPTEVYHGRMIRAQRLWLSAVVLAAAATSTAASGAGSTGTTAGGPGFYNGDQLWDECRTEPPSRICDGYVAGIADAMGSAQALGMGVLGFHACFRVDLAISQLTDVVKLYLHEHPEKRDFLAASLVADALARAFPCP